MGEFFFFKHYFMIKNQNQTKQESTFWAMAKWLELNGTRGSLVGDAWKDGAFSFFLFWLVIMK